ncbi:MAG: hypothetical protein RLO12_14335, partial [Fulvivirga sp.]
VMYKKLRVLFLLLIIGCAEDSLHKVPIEERFDFDINLIENDFSREGVEIRLDSLNGSVISEDSLDQIRPDTIGFDYYANSNNELMVIVTRKKELADHLLQKRWDSLVTNNIPFLIKSLKASKMDSIEIANIVSIYETNGLLVSYSVDCENVRSLLLFAGERDQEVRQGGLSSDAQKVDRENQELLLSIFQCCGSIAIERAGNDVAQAAFLILQHASHEMRLEYFEVFESWAKEGIIKASTLALMVDRMRMHEGQPQLFGSQITSNEKGEQVFYEIDNLEKVRARRDSLFMEPLEDYVARFGVTLE